MKKSLYFIALIGAVLMFFIFPVVSNASLSTNWNITTAGKIYLTDTLTTPPFNASQGVRLQINLAIYPAIDCDHYAGMTTGWDYKWRFTDGTFDMDDYAPAGNGTMWLGLGSEDFSSCPNFPTFFEYVAVCRIATNDYTMGACAPPEPEIVISTPTTGTTITDTSTLLTGEWINVDSTIWTNLKITFNDYLIGETSKIVNIPITSDYDDFSIPLSDFEITKNGDWTLTAIVENNYEYDFDIPNPTYGLTFNVGGLPTPYAFTDFDDWYTENVDNYETPSAWASSMIGFLQPIFEKVGEYGNRIESYLNISDAYDKGFQIGGVFPVVIAYVEKIDLFFGGFPITQFFKWIIIAMIGLFGVKAILKLLSFIPFFGGSG